MSRANLFVYVGTYTRKESFVDGKAPGIEILNYDPQSGILTRFGCSPAGDNPSFLALSPDQSFLYAVNEITRNAGPNGWITAFSIDPSNGNLSYLNQQSTEGSSPCHLCITGDGRFVIGANYESGNICLLSRNEDGSLAPACDVVHFSGSGSHPRQEGPHAHMVTPTPDERLILAVDLGRDRIWVFELDTTQGKLLPTENPYVTLPDGSGPRHIAFHPNGRFGYVLGELDSTVTSLNYDSEDGIFHLIDTVTTLPDGFQGQSSGAEIQVDPSGKFVYVSNRGHDSLTIFAVDHVNGQLSLIGHQSTLGKTPRHFTIDPSGKNLIVANQDSDSLVVFQINPDNGNLSMKGPLISTPTPVCIQFA